MVTIIDGSDHNVGNENEVDFQAAPGLTPEHIYTVIEYIQAHFLHPNALIGNIEQVVENEFEIFLNCCEFVANSNDQPLKTEFYLTIMRASRAGEIHGIANKFNTVREYFRDLTPGDCQLIEQELKNYHQQQQPQGLVM